MSLGNRVGDPLPLVVVEAEVGGPDCVGRHGLARVGRWLNRPGTISAYADNTVKLSRPEREMTRMTAIEPCLCNLLRKAARRSRPSTSRNWRAADCASRNTACWLR